MEGKSLELVGNSSDIKTLMDYFPSQSKYQPVSSPAKSIISKEAIKVLLNEVAKSREFVKWAIICLEDFTSNKKIEREWLEYHKDLSQLVEACVSCVCDTQFYKPHLKRLCYIIFFLGEKGDPLSSALFNTCAEKLLTFQLQCGIEFERKILLASLCTLCRLSEPSHIAVAYKSMRSSLDLLAKTIIALPIEDQISAFYLLSKSFCSRADAFEKVSTWFPKWSSLQKALTDYFPLKLNEGCGIFLDQLFSFSECITVSETENSSSAYEEDTQTLVPKQHSYSASFSHATPSKEERLSHITKKDKAKVVPRCGCSSRLYYLDKTGKFHFIPQGPPPERWTSFKRDKPVKATSSRIAGEYFL